ncbi:MAG: hypothetical protein EP341_09400 [Sphingomonadales bacterium]|nr:MAG: hypothetical protein EP341_09400 [Sphingomonadales bacterium]
MLFEEDAQHDEVWGGRKDWGTMAVAEPVAQQQDIKAVLTAPEWLRKPVGQEPRPPRPLAPSSVGDDQGTDPPIAGADLENAARRGVLIHGLLERLPEIAPEAREEAATAWLARHGVEFTSEEQDEIARRVLAVLDHPEFAEVFGPESLAEVPLAAVVNGQVIAGFADRLLVTPESVTVVDFKSARRPPSSLEEIQSSTLGQMAAYVAVLEVIYPGREVKAAVLYTQTAQIFELPRDLIELHKKRF